MTKTELASRLIECGLVKESEVDPHPLYPDDADTAVIQHFLMYPEGKAAGLVEWPRPDLDEALFFAAQSSTGVEWLRALHRYTRHQIWKFVQATNTAGFSEVELHRHQEALREIEEEIESDDWDAKSPI